MPSSLDLPPALAPASADDRLINIREVCKRTSFSRVTIHNWVKRGTFPKPIHIGYAIRWKVRDVSDWIAAQVAADRGAR